jgi:hypothetical protein
MVQLGFTYYAIGRGERQKTTRTKSDILATEQVV